MKRAMMKCALIVVALLPAATTGHTQQNSDPRVADLVGTGKIRVGLFLPQYTKDAATGALKGVRIEIVHALATRLGIQPAFLEHPTPLQAIACLKTGACDLLFLPFDARAADVGDFSSPIFQFDYTLLVPAHSPVRRVAAADRTGVRIAAVRNHASTLELARQLKHAELVYADTPDPTFELLRGGGAQAMASARQTLLGYVSQLPGSQVLADYYGANINRLVVPKGKAEWLAYVGEFVEEAKASGLVQKAIEVSGEPG